MLIFFLNGGSYMKRMLALFAAMTMLFTTVSAENLPGTSPDADQTLVFTPESTPAPELEPELTPEPTTPEPLSVSEGQLQFDFSQVDNPLATPVAIDPIDKPTPSPTPAPNFIYETYVNETMGVSFSVPYTWLMNPSTNLDTTVQFVEPKSEMMEPDGYQTRITIEKVNMGLTQTQADARARLESTLTELENSFTTFTPGNIANASMADANGAYCYYRAEYSDGTKTYSMNGRIMIVAYGNALYQVRITTPRNWYSYYEYVFRKVRSTFAFQ